MFSSREFRLAAALTAACAFTSGVTYAEEVQKPTVASPQPATAAIQTANGDFHWSVDSGAVYQASTDIDGGGDFSASRYSLGGGGVIHLNDQFQINFGGGYERDDYRFSHVTRMGNDPWENVNIVGLQASLGYRLDDHWTIYGGPLLGFSAEDAASWGRSFTGGGAAGAAYRFNDKLTLGAGVGVMSQLEDSVAIFPIIRLDWEMTDQLSLRAGTFDLGVQGGAGVELGYKIIPALEIAGGVQYQDRRFRLDRRGIAPDGVGEQSALPVYIRATWHPMPQVSVGGFAGVLLGGRLEIDDQDGHNITRKNFDPAAILGGQVSVQF